jgi:dihydroflavonol-4-reductase
MQTFVTGGTGLLGNTLVRELLAAGHDVKALVRSPEKAERVLGDLEVDLVVGDMLDVGGFESELEGAEVLFHTAAYFREYYEPGDHWETLERVNVDATVELLAAADRHGVARAIHVSSSGVVGPGPDGAPGDETTLLEPEETDNLYFRSKVLAERAIDEFLESHDLPVVRVLPGWMFGPGDAAPTTAGRIVLDLVHGDLSAVFDGGGHVTDVRDVARTMLAAVDRGVPGERYVVAGPYATLIEIADTVESVTSVPAPPRLPIPLVAVAARISELYGRLTGEPVLLTPEGVSTLRTDVRLDSSKAERELGATFRPLAETLRDEVAWFLGNGYLDADVGVELSGSGDDGSGRTDDRVVAGERPRP